MSNKNQFCITFAGAIGSSKSPIAFYLSAKLNLPIFGHDYIRTEVAEDLLENTSEKYMELLTSKRTQRFNEILSSTNSFIYDVSVDRKWETAKKELQDAGYEIFLISMDISKELLTKFYEVKGYLESLKRIDSLLSDHQMFLEKYSADINLHISDNEFLDRFTVVETAVKEWINS